LAAVTALALASGCSDAPPPVDTAGGTTASQGEATTTAADGADGEEAPPAEAAPADDRSLDGEAMATTCADLDVAVLEQVEGVTPEPSPSEDEVMRAFDRLADADAPEVAAMASDVVPLFALDPDDMSMERQQAGIQAMEGLLEWGAARCDVDAPIWACLYRSSFQPVGEAILDPDDPVPPPTEPGAATAEQALAPEDGEGERVEVERTDDVVVFAWVDERGNATSSRTVTRSEGGGWVAGVSTDCRMDG
jgi:hypothetical protein